MTETTRLMRLLHGNIDQEKNLSDFLTEVWKKNKKKNQCCGYPLAPSFLFCVLFLYFVDLNPWCPASAYDSWIIFQRLRTNEAQKLGSPSNGFLWHRSHKTRSEFPRPTPGQLNMDNGLSEMSLVTSEEVVKHLVLYRGNAISIIASW
jgi:hypothetical protein